MGWLDRTKDESWCAVAGSGVTIAPGGWKMNLISALTLADTWGMHGGDVGVGWMIVMMFMMVLFWAAVIVGIVWLVRGAASGDWGFARGRRETPIDILERRFAEGAISVEEYHERREAIGRRES